MKKTLLVLLLLLFSSKAVVAKDYGIHGTTYQISEKDFLKDISEKLQAAQKDGKLAKFQNDLKTQMVTSVNSPKGVDGITKASTNREWFFDPSISKPTDLADQTGKVFYRAGTKVNPLDYISMTQALIFIDGDDEIQVKWALKQYKQLKSKAKIILIRGKIIDLMRAKKVRFYFDQGGNLTSKFSIKAVPAVVEQEGKMLKVREVAL
jgi:conjugal transfer pilus assembly protein TraW